MKIGLINPNREIKEPAIHLGLGYIVSYARSEHPDLHFILLDTRTDGKKAKTSFYNTTFDLVGITATSQTFKEAYSIAELLRKKYPSLPICIGGSHPSTYLEGAITGYPFDYAIVGEGEVTFSELISFLKGKLPITKINGLIYKDEKGKTRKNPSRELIKEIDQIPFPAYDLFKTNRYPHHRLITSRGCPYRCAFCNSHSIWTNKWRKRSAENVISEIAMLLTNYSMKSFVFNDDTFNIDLKRVEKICNYLIENRYGIIWSTSVRADRINEKIAGKMKQSGCYSVSIGIESANNEVLQKMGKNTTIETISDGIRILRKAGIDVMGQFMIGNPGDTLNTIKESIEFAGNSGLNGIEFYPILPYRDTEVWEYVNTRGTWLTGKPGYEFHTVDPRIIFETPEFVYNERLQAIELARKQGYYHALSADRRNLLLDSGKNLARFMQSSFDGTTGNKIYLFLRKVYRKYFRKGTTGNQFILF
ncbi:MAG: radical SAM protein [Bacteroidales bacterium]|nr:MAG: radical SAM protein [Bacteroidales bacterium]